MKFSNLYKHDFKFPLKSFDYTRLRLSLRVPKFWGFRAILVLRIIAKKSLFTNKKGV
ncbi:Hypothetical protein HPV225_1480 [Helicobacter pylori v225d]|nr:Hypothetical protein HPV225_1480 [Helicobacter pylori v225d]